MKQRYTGPDRAPETVEIAGFGGARLVRHLDGRLEIVGGTPEEQAQACAWQERFIPPPSPPMWKPKHK